MLTPAHESYYMSADGYLVVYSVVDRESLGFAEKVLQRICTLKRGRRSMWKSSCAVWAVCSGWVILEMYVKYFCIQLVI